MSIARRSKRRRCTMLRRDASIRRGLRSATNPVGRGPGSEANASGKIFSATCRFSVVSAARDTRPMPLRRSGRSCRNGRAGSRLRAPWVVGAVWGILRPGHEPLHSAPEGKPEATESFIHQLGHAQHHASRSTIYRRSWHCPWVGVLQSRHGAPAPQPGKAKTNRLLPMLGRSSGVRGVKYTTVRELPVLTATYCRPSIA